MPSFDLALALFRPTPTKAALAEGLQELAEHLESTSAFDGDLEAFWSPNGHAAMDAHRLEKDWLPVRSIAPIWLSRMARPEAAEGILEGMLYQIYCRSLDDPTRIRGLDFLHRGQNHPRAIALCSDLLTLRHFPRRFLPEILGVTLAHESMELQGTPPEIEQHQRALAAQKTALETGVDAIRIRQGFALYRSAALSLFSEPGDFAPALTHREAFARIVAEKAGAAKGYHAKIQLEDLSLDDWFENHGKSPEPILRALEKSPFIDQACPFGSRLIKAMDFGGPMFGVFDEADLKAASAWIASPESASDKTVPASPKLRQAQRLSDPHPVAPRIRGNRDLFHHLVSAENAAELPREGLALIHRILRRTRQLQHLRVAPQPFGYSPGRLDQFLEERHAAALRTPQRRSFSVDLTREDWRWTLTQLSPAVLVDGAWLSGVSSTPGSPQPWHLELMKIHEDELGNGDPARNHPRIYRRLMESLDVYLPKIGEPAFVKDARIHSSAFDFPSYMVAMGWHYAQFEPECLGLNLAIELSGLGSGYQRVIASLRKAGIDPLIAELHLSIDNLASGHARRARDAIVLFLENIARTEGPDGEKRTWERIHQGYLSYAVGLGSIGILIMARYLLSGKIKIHK